VLPFFDPKLRKGPSDFDIRHNAVINFLWNVPGKKDATGIAGWAANGWQLGSIFSVSSGSPFTPIVDGDPLGLNGSSNFAFPNVVNTPDCSSRVNSGNPVHYIKTQCYSMPNPTTVLGNARRNSLYGPGLTNLDMSFFKNNYLNHSEKVNLQFRGEIFNILNHTNFAAPCATCGNTSLFDQGGAPLATAGQIVSTQTTSRQIQLALKLIF
jgi:hypothetical protein